MNDQVIYLDNNSTTKVDPRVLESMLPFFSELYGNASSSHFLGNEVNKRISIARSDVAHFLGTEASNVKFTSGSTESINLAIKGFALANQHKGKNIITVKTEHSAVLETCRYLESIGFSITYLDVTRNGEIDLTQLRSSILKDTIMVCVMLANNETGVIHPIREISKIVHEKKSTIFCDATQGAGKIKIDVDNLEVDFLTISAHKFYGPKGIGALYVKDVKRNLNKITPQLHGGNHENGFRSGTLNTTGIIGMATACNLYKDLASTETDRIQKLRDSLESQLLQIPGTHVNCSGAKRLGNTSSIYFKGIDANVMIGLLRTVAISNGSACTSAVIEPSHVLKALGLNDDDANSTLRFSIGRFNTSAEITQATQLIKEVVNKLMLSHA